MEDWYCFKCKEKMVDAEVTMSYYDVTAKQPGIRCPKCGTAYLTEKSVIEIINPGEEEIESKF